MALEYPPATPKKRPGDPETLLAVVVKACRLKPYSECSSISNVECFTGKSSSRNYSEKTFIGSDPKLDF
jgi:hypothetical protein